MKKWHIITAASLLLIIILAVISSFVYRHIIVPGYVEPIAEKFSNYLKDEDVLETLYKEAADLHDEGIIEDDIYASFITVYNKHIRDDAQVVQELIDEKNEPDVTEVESTSISTRYASHRVGIEMVQINENEGKGKANSRYSSERTSDRMRAEDVLEAEKSRSISDAEQSDTEGLSEAESKAYDKLRANMTASDFATFGKIIAKLDRGILRTFFDSADKEGLKEYLHANLDGNEYKQIVNLGYKYAYLFID